MRKLLLSGLLLMGAAAFASEGQITMSQDSVTPTASSHNSSGEAGVQYSSINSGSTYATVGYFHEFDNGFALGGRGYMPLQFNKQAQAYMAQLVGRFMLLNDVNHAFIDANLTQGFFNTDSNTTPFVLIGGGVGFMHELNKQFSVGGQLGADYSPTRISGDKLATANTFYNRIGVIGTYAF